MYFTFHTSHWSWLYCKILLNGTTVSPAAKTSDLQLADKKGFLENLRRKSCPADNLSSLAGCRHFPIRKGDVHVKTALYTEAALVAVIDAFCDGVESLCTKRENVAMFPDMVSLIYSFSYLKIVIHVLYNLLLPVALQTWMQHHVYTSYHCWLWGHVKVSLDTVFCHSPNERTRGAWGECALLLIS